MCFSIPFFSNPFLRILDRILMVLPIFMNHGVIHQDLVDQKTFPGILISSYVFHSIPTSRPGVLELEVIRAWWGTLVRLNCVVSQDRRRIDSLFVIPDRVALVILSIFVVVFFDVLDSNILSILPPIIVVFEIPLMKALSSSSLRMFSEIKFIRTEFSGTLKNRIFCDLLNSHWHRLFRWPFFDIDSAAVITKPSLSSIPFCLATVFRLHAFFCLSLWRAKSSWETCETEDLNTVGTPNCAVISFVVFEKSEIWGLDRQWASCHCPQKWSCRTLWDHNLCLHLIWPGSQTSRCRCGVARVLPF